MGHFTVELRWFEAKWEAVGPCRPAPATAPGVLPWMLPNAQIYLLQASRNVSDGEVSMIKISIISTNEQIGHDFVFCYLFGYFWIVCSPGQTWPSLAALTMPRCQTAFRMEALLGGELHRTYVKNKHIFYGSKEHMTLSKTVKKHVIALVYNTYNLLVMTCINIYIYIYI
jgi:hypothetical protein